MMTAELDHLARKLFGARNRADWAAYRALAHPDLILEEGSSGNLVVGVDAVLDAWQRARTTFPVMTAQIIELRQVGMLMTGAVVWQAVEAGTDKLIEIDDVVTLVWVDSRLVLERYRIGFLSAIEPLHRDADRTEPR